MQYRSIKQVEAVTGSTPQELANNFNEAMRRLQGCSPKDEWHGDVVYIYYYANERVAECLAEEHQLAGDEHSCDECPFCTRALNASGQVDARRKWAVCGKTGEPVRISNAACDEYYSLVILNQNKGDSETMNMMNKDVRNLMFSLNVDQRTLAAHLGVTQARISQILCREMSEELRAKFKNAIKECAADAATF